jgi:hypothetical protein
MMCSCGENGLEEPHEEVKTQSEWYHSSQVRGNCRLVRVEGQELRVG